MEVSINGGTPAIAGWFALGTPMDWKPPFQLTTSIYPTFTSGHLTESHNLQWKMGEQG